MHSIRFTVASFLVALLLATSAHAQLKDLTLADAVLRQYKELAPERLTQLQWLPGGKHYSHIKEEAGSVQVLKIDAESGREVVYFTLEDLKSALPEAGLEKIPRFNFLENGLVLFQVGQSHYQYSPVGKSGKKLFTLPEGAEHTDFNEQYTHCAYIKDNNVHVLLLDGTDIQLTSDGGKGIVYGSAVHRFEFGIAKGFFWAPDGKKLAFYRMDESMVETYPLVNTNDVPATVDPIRYPMAGRKSHHVTLGVYNVGKSGITYMQVDGPKDQYLTAVTWSPASDKVFIGVLNRDQNKLELNSYSAQSGLKLKTILKESHEKYVEPEHGLWFLPDSPDQFLWFSERTGYQHLYHYNTNGELLKNVTEGNWEAHDILGLDQTGNYLFIEGTGETIKRINSEDRTRNGMHRFIYMIDFKLGGSQLIDSTLGTHSAKLADNGRYLLTEFQSNTVPRKSLLFSSNGKRLREVHSAKNPLAEYTIGTAEFFEVLADDREVLYGRIIKPSNFDPTKKYPVMWYLYGGPHAQLVTDRWLTGAPMWMYWMAEQGYIVAAIDSRGSANRGLEFEQKTFRQLGMLEMVDQKTGIDYLASKPWVDKNRMAIHGWSYGGFMTISMMQAWPELFQAGVAGGPVCDWSMYEVMYTERYMDTPEANSEGYKASNVIAKASMLERPLLVIHGTVDDVVLWQNSQAFVKACVDEGVQLDYFIYPGHPHNVRGKDRVHLIQKMYDYVDLRLR